MAGSRGASGTERPFVGLRLGACLSRGRALIPACAECEAVWLPADEARWQASLTDDEPPEVILYCPECAEREFGDR